MAKRRTNIIEINMGNVILYKWKGKDKMRAKGRTGRQASVAKKQAKILGRASAIAARIRSAIAPILPPPITRDVLNRFNKAVQQWLRLDQKPVTEPFDNIPFISGFNFYGPENVGDYLSHFIVKRITADSLELHITDLDPSVYKGILSTKGLAKLHFIVASVNVKNPRDQQSTGLEIEIPYTAGYFPGRVLSIPMETCPGHLTVVAFATDKRNVSIAGAMYN